jgi:co-chaperonin GroES (HSP10)
MGNAAGGIVITESAATGQDRKIVLKLIPVRIQGVGRVVVRIDVDEGKEVM